MGPAGGTPPAGGDRIEVRGLRVLGTHGVLDEERTRPQPFCLDLDLWLDAAAAAGSDDLADTADYAAVLDVAAGVVGAGPPHRLLESLAVAVAEAVLAADPRVTGVGVTLCKLRPPVPHDVGSVGVRVERRRAGPA